MFFYYALNLMYPVSDPEAIDDQDYFDTFGLADGSSPVLEAEEMLGNGSLAEKDTTYLADEMVVKQIV
jgi:hypothetical protein